MKLLYISNYNIGYYRAHIPEGDFRMIFQSAFWREIMAWTILYVDQRNFSSRLSLEQLFKPIHMKYIAPYISTVISLCTRAGKTRYPPRRTQPDIECGTCLIWGWKNPWLRWQWFIGGRWTTKSLFHKISSFIGIWGIKYTAYIREFWKK